MGFPVTTTEGETVQIVDKEGDNVLIAEDGRKFAPTLDALVSAEVEGSEAVEVEDDSPDATASAVELAEAEGVDLSEVEGSGEDGRILKSDVEATVEAEDDLDAA